MEAARPIWQFFFGYWVLDSKVLFPRYLCYEVGDDVLGETGATGYTNFSDGHGSTSQLMAGDGSGVAEDGVSQRAQYYDYDAYGEAFWWELDEPDSGVSCPLTDMLYAGEQWDAESYSARHQGDGVCRQITRLRYSR